MRSDGFETIYIDNYQSNHAFDATSNWLEVKVQEYQVNSNADSFLVVVNNMMEKTKNSTVTYKCLFGLGSIFYFNKLKNLSLQDKDIEVRPTIILLGFTN